MFASTLILAALTTLASAGTLYVDNNCTFPIYLNSRASNVSPGPLITIPARRINGYNEIERGPASQQNAITISRTPDLANPIQFVYSQQTSGTDFYSMSTIYGDPFRAEGFEVLTSAGGFQIVCGPRAGGCCPNTYCPTNQGGNGAVFTQSNDGNFVIRTCRYDGRI